jgi:hypothetical protein
VAALSDEAAIGEILRAASAVAGATLDLDVADPAADAGIVDVDVHGLRFRHPLIRSAVAQSAGVADRRGVHEALPDVLVDQDRRAWHRAALISGPHEDIAAELEAAGRRARRRGATPVAVTAMRRAAELGEPEQRDRRLLTAAELALELGQPDVVIPLLRQLEPQRPGTLERARLAWIEEMVDPKPLYEQRVTTLMALAGRGAGGWRRPPNRPGLARGLTRLVREPEPWEILVDAARRLHAPGRRSPGACHSGCR